MDFGGDWNPVQDQEGRRAIVAAELSTTLRIKVARPERVELPTFWFVARRSIQLSYGRTGYKYLSTSSG